VDATAAGIAATPPETTNSNNNIAFSTISLIPPFVIQRFFPPSFFRFRHGTKRVSFVGFGLPWW